MDNSIQRKLMDNSTQRMEIAREFIAGCFAGKRIFYFTFSFFS